MVMLILCTCRLFKILFSLLQAAVGEQRLTDLNVVRQHGRVAIMTKMTIVATRGVMVMLHMRKEEVKGKRETRRRLQS